MSCSKFETDIALHAGGDLPAGSVARVESHLAECADCRALAEELRAGQALLGELSDEPLEDAMLAAVRGHVLRQLWGSPSACGGLSGRPYWKLALAAALVLAAVLAWPRHRSGAAPRAAAASHAAQAEAARGPAAARGAAPLARRSRHHRRRAPVEQPGPPLLVQFVTDDPNIVVYWLVDQKPQGD
jgi:anti-sigma factor RsiW